MTKSIKYKHKSMNYLLLNMINLKLRFKNLFKLQKQIIKVRLNFWNTKIMSYKGFY
jgi:hypothetical protein